MTDQEKIQLASSRKEVGNLLFKQRRWTLALNCYKRVPKILNDRQRFSRECFEKSKDVLLSAELNLAACALHLEEWKLARDTCDNVLKQSSMNLKALFRRGSAKVGLGDFDSAVDDLKKCLELEPHSSDAKRMMQEALKGQRAADNQCKGVYSKMCKGLGRPPDSVIHKDKENSKPIASTERQLAMQLCTAGHELKVSRGPGPSETKSANDKLLKPGVCVRIDGLVSRAELNGQEGRLRVGYA